MKTIESAIAIIRNSGRILLTWDDDWDSWLLPNQTIHEPDTPEHAQGTLAIDYLPCMPFRHYRVPPTLIVGNCVELKDAAQCAEGDSGCLCEFPWSHITERHRSLDGDRKAL